MSSEAYYPALDLRGVSGVRIALDQLEMDPLWLDRVECPYEPGMVEGLRLIWMRSRVARKAGPIPVEEPEGGAPDAVWEDLMGEAHAVFQAIRTMREEMNETDEMGVLRVGADARVAYFKMATATMEKLIQVGERAKNIRHVSDFTKRVLDVFDQVLDPEQRTRATEMLGVNA